MKRIVSVWFPNFSLDRLKRQVRVMHPGRGQRFVDETLPFALVVKEGQALKVAAANQAACHGGVGAGMALADAFAILPVLQTRALAAARDAATLKRLARWCVAYAPWTTVDERDGLLLEITGTGRVFGGEEVLLQTMVTRLRAAGFATHVGVAPTPGAAWALARFAQPQKQAGRQEHGSCPVLPTQPCVFHGPLNALQERLGPLAIEALRISPEDVRVLRRLGLSTIAHVLALPRASLVRRFGSRSVAATIVTRLDQMFGRQAEPISPLASQKHFQSRKAFAEPLETSESFAAHVAELLEPLCRDLALADKGARTLTLVACRSDASTRRISIKTARASANPVHLAKLFEHKLPDIDPGFGIDAFVLSAPRTGSLAPHQSDLKKQSYGHLKAGNTNTKNIAPLVDQLSTRLGDNNVFRLKACAHHWPEHTEVRCRMHEQCEEISFLQALPAQPFLAPRPLRLFCPPEPIEVLAPAPDARPNHFCWRRVRHRVVRASGPERILPEWWQNLDAPQRPRDYYDVEDSAGRRFWIFRDHDGTGSENPGRERWCLHGVFP